jgi:hypothetical protein
VIGSVDPIGARRRLVTVEQLDEARRSSGYPGEDWSTLCSVYMAREDFGGQGGARRERFVADQVAAVVETRWQMAYRADMDPERIDVPKRRRLVAEGRVYNVTSASIVGNRAAIELLTQAAVG